jgi:hypothetical protein
VLNTRSTVDLTTIATPAKAPLQRQQATWPPIYANDALGDQRPA